MSCELVQDYFSELVPVRERCAGFGEMAGLLFPLGEGLVGLPGDLLVKERPANGPSKTAQFPLHGGEK